MTKETVKEIEINEVKRAYMENRTFEGAMCDFMRIITSNLIEIKIFVQIGLLSHQELNFFRQNAYADMCSVGRVDTSVEGDGCIVGF